MGEEWLKDFWRRVLHLAEVRGFDLHARYSGRKERALAAISGINAVANYRYVIRKGNQVGVELYLYRTGDHEGVKRLYDKVHKFKNEVELEYGKKLDWHRHHRRIRSWVRDSLGIALDPNGSNWDDAASQMITAMQKLHAVFQPVLLRLGESWQSEHLLSAINEINLPQSESQISSQQRELNLDLYLEGFESETLRNNYERDSCAAKQAKKIHGDSCVVCGFNFGSTYGDHGQGFIEAHHLFPVSDGARHTNPETDMTVLCSNCHRMIHRGTEMLSVAALRSIVEHAEVARSKK